MESPESEFLFEAIDWWPEYEIQVESGGGRVDEARMGRRLVEGRVYLAGAGCVIWAGETSKQVVFEASFQGVITADQLHVSMHNFFRD